MYFSSGMQGHFDTYTDLQKIPPLYKNTRVFISFSDHLEPALKMGLMTMYGDVVLVSKEVKSEVYAVVNLV